MECSSSDDDELMTWFSRQLLQMVDEWWRARKDERNLHDFTDTHNCTFEMYRAPLWSRRGGQIWETSRHPSRIGFYFMMNNDFPSFGGVSFVGWWTMWWGQLKAICVPSIRILNHYYASLGELSELVYVYNCAFCSKLFAYSPQSLWT